MEWQGLVLHDSLLFSCTVVDASDNTRYACMPMMGTLVPLLCKQDRIKLLQKSKPFKRTQRYL